MSANTPKDQNELPTNAVYSSFTNQYVLTKEMCAEAELSRIDIGIAYICITFLFVFIVLLQSASETAFSLQNAVENYFAAPSASTILQLSGAAGITFVSPVVAVIAFLKVFPKLVGEKQFKEHMKLVPGTNRNIDFYEDHVVVAGKFRKELPYRELKRTGETRHLYLLYFTDRRILILDKAGFRKGNLRDLKSFLKKRRSTSSRLYGIARLLPVLLIFLLFCAILLLEG